MPCAIMRRAFAKPPTPWEQPMITSRMTSKSQTTIPKQVRQALGAGPGDLLAYRIEDGRVIVTKVSAVDAAYLKAVGATLSEWNSPEDAAAYDDL